MDFLKYWSIENFEISTYKWGIKNRVNSTFKYSGSDHTGSCIYKYNELGFRGDSIHKTGFKVMSIGCSFTEGVGINNHETWSSKFTNNILNGVNMNFGTGGRSNDFIVRCLFTYYDLIKPDLVLIMYTSPSRREIYTKDNGIEPFIPTATWGFLKDDEEGKSIQKNLVDLQNDNEDMVNWYKNHLLIKYFLESKKCNWIWNGWFGVPTNYNEINRFDGEYDKFIDRGVDGAHPGPKHNTKYAEKLFNHIHSNFKDYLPTDISLLKNNLI
jgi:hypothetical protein